MSAAVIEGAQAPQSIWNARWRRFRRHRLAMAATIFLILLGAACAGADLIAAALGVDPSSVDLFSRFSPPSSKNLLGTDEIGRDVLVRLLHGGRISLMVGLLATALGGVFGVLIGVLSGYLEGRTDAFLMRFTDCVLSLPIIPLLIVLGAVDLAKLGLPQSWLNSPSVSFWRIVVVIALVDWTAIARISRAATLSVKHRDYVQAARASGASSFYNILAHVLPNIATPLIVACALTVGRVILFESTLSFLGFGVVPPTPTWGNMLTNAQELVTSAPLLAIYPGLLILLTVIAVNLIGDGIRVAFDPRSDS
jgi:peptide/nickel transport system permease protein